MLPQINEDLKQFEIYTHPSHTYRLNIEKETVRGYIDNLDSVKQAVYKILNTERYENVIYSWNYGIELAELFGRSKDYIISELPSRIREALIQDDRIESVNDFKFTDGKRGILSVSFTVKSVEGSFDTGLEVKI